MNYLRLAAVFVLLFTGPTWAAKPPSVPITEDVQAVVNGGNEFAADLYARLRDDEDSNLFFSPYSLSSALAMAYAGAAGETKSQMAQVLHFPVPDSQLHPAFNSLRHLLTFTDQHERIQLRVANRLWGQEGFQFRPEFLQVTNDNYGADLGLLEFRQTETARKTINSWVEEQTDHKIQELLAPGVLEADSRLVLTNAIYFKAKWERSFKERQTADAPFHVSASLQVPVPTMHQTYDLGYAESRHVQVLEMPFGWHERKISMLILLPKTIDGLSDLEQKLTSKNLQKCSERLVLRSVRVHLPKFKIASAFNLKKVLEWMGMPLVFSENADFSRMSSQEPRLAISDVVHKTFVEVNEEGTEAAAATTAALAPSKDPEEDVEFRADHPFIFLIRDNRTESILFLGRVVNPKE